MTLCIAGGAGTIPALTKHLGWRSDTIRVKSDGLLGRASHKVRKTVAADVRRRSFPKDSQLCVPPPHVGGYFVSDPANAAKNPKTLLDVRSHKPKLAGNEPDAKAILPEPRSVKQQIAV